MIQQRGLTAHENVRQVGGMDPDGKTQIFELDADGNLKVAFTGDLEVGDLEVTPVTAAASTLTNVTESASNQTLLAANADRLAFLLFNDSDAICLVKLGATASATSHIKAMLPREYFATKDLGVNYIGRIDGIWLSAPGTVGHDAMRITELEAV